MNNSAQISAIKALFIIAQNGQGVTYGTSMLSEKNCVKQEIGHDMNELQ